MTIKYLPVTGHTSEASVVAIWQGREIRYADFVTHVHEVVHKLPERQFAINLCEDRYLFLVAFIAVLVKKQTNLLPASKLPALINEMAEDYTGSYVLSDNQNLACDFLLKADELLQVNSEKRELICIKAEHVAAVVFTSGSTGKSRPNIKRWGSLYTEAALAIDRFALQTDDVDAIVATVPPQHMYGLVTSIIIPLLSAIKIVCAPTLYPADIELAVNSAAGNSVLITTPIHLRACVDSGSVWDNIKFVISATAMMPLALARNVEQRLQTRLYEIYGASEYGSVATRRSVNDTVWSLYEGMAILSKNGCTYLQGPQFKNDIVVHDVVEIKDSSHFELVGRDCDLIKIAGKRISLTDLNQKLWDIDGVVDGVFFAPLESHKFNARLTAFVVAPGLSKAQVLAAMKKHIEPAFLPRPLILMAELPRNATGKLPQKELQNLLEAMAIN